jgi:hypothetical protein
MRSQFPIAATILVLVTSGLGAQGSPRDTLCVAVFNELQPSFSNLEQPLSASARANGCSNVASIVQASLLEARRSTFNTDREENQRRRLEAVQTTRAQTASVAGEPTSTVEPIETAGGSVGAVGSEDGTSAVAAFAVNPALFFVSPTDEEATAKWSRFTDFSLLVPVSDADEDEDGDVDYIGFRWRINITGLSAGDALLKAVQASFARILDQGTEEHAAILSALTKVSNAALKPCLEALLRAGQVGMTVDGLATAFETGATTCGQEASLLKISEALYTQLDDDIRKARVVADSRYFGLDLRGDFGDLERFGIDTLAGTSLIVGLGFGRRFAFLNSIASNGIRANLGAKYFDPNGPTKARFGATGGVAYEAIRYYDHQRLSFAAGLEFEVDANADDDAGGSRDLIAFRTSLNVPLGGTTSVSVSFGAPIAGSTDLGPTLTVKANWRLLWSR